VVVCLERGADLHMAQLMPLPQYSLSLASVKSRLVLHFWYWLTRVVPDKGSLSGCVCVCVCVRVTLLYSDVIIVPYLCQLIFYRHLVGKTLRNVCH